MKPFRFSLQAVRTVRERQERQALEDYIATLRALDETKRRVRAAEEDLGAAWESFRRAAGSDTTAAELTQVQDYCELMLQRKREADAALQAARLKAKRAFARYLAARQACAVVEKFYERQLQGHDRHRRRHEQKLSDDLAQRSLSLASALVRRRRLVWN